LIVRSTRHIPALVKMGAAQPWSLVTCPAQSDIVLQVDVTVQVLRMTASLR
jgi:hypothetical protein